MFITVISTVISYSNAKRSSAKEIHALSASEINKLIFKFDNIMSFNSELVSDITKNKYFSDIFYNNISTQDEFEICEIKLLQDIHDAAVSNPNISALAVYFKNTDTVISSYGKYNPKIYHDFYYRSSETSYDTWYERINSNNFSDYLLCKYLNESSIDFFYQLPGGSMGTAEATLIVTYSRDTLCDSQYFASQKDMLFNVVTPNDTYIFETDTTLSSDDMPTTSGTLRQGKNTYIYDTSPSTNWKYYVKISDNIYFHRLFFTYLFNLAINLICILLSSAICVYIIFNIYKPLNKISNDCVSLTKIDNTLDEYKILNSFIDSYKQQQNSLRTMEYSILQLKQMHTIERKILDPFNNDSPIEFGIEFISDIFAVIIFKIINSDKLFFNNPTNNNDGNNIFFILKNVCTELIGLSGNKFFITNVNGNIVGLINFNSDAKTHTSNIIHNEIKPALLNSQNFIKENFGFSISAYISESCIGSENIYNLYYNAKNIFDNRIEPFENEIIYTNVVHEAESDKMSKTSKNLVDDIIFYVTENFHNENINISTIACEFGLTPYYISTKFKQATGVQLNDYVTRLRIDKSKELLLNSTDSIEKISSSVGFGSTKTFTRAFIKFQGTTPGKFRYLSPDLNTD